MKLYVKNMQDRWVDYPDDKDVRLKIRPFPMSNGILFDTSEKRLTEYTWDKFNYCVVDWEGILDENDNPLECNDENKRLIFDYGQEIVMWVSLKINESVESILEKKT